MKKTLLLTVCIFSCCLLLQPTVAFAQSGWDWITGSNIINKNSIYGSQGVGSYSITPGARYASATWKDGSGNFWLYGGWGYPASGGNAMLSDLWEYNIAGNYWTWVSGSSASGVGPVYGTKGVPSYTNSPGCRDVAAFWTDASGNFWLFGGQPNGGGGSYYNDLWKYNITLGQWAWMSGDNTVNHNGVYGTQGTPAGTNKPGGNQGAVGWTDASDNLWLFGGRGYPSSGGTGVLNDVWEYNTVSGEWTWMNGNNAVSTPGVYGTLGTAAAANTPGGRYGDVTWTDASGKFWLFGGFPDLSGVDFLNDLWKYDPGTNNWTWMSGDNTMNKNGVYGTKCTSASTNKPGSRYLPQGCTDASGNFWLFGGLGFSASGGSNGGQNRLNDLWKYDGSNWTWVGGDSTIDVNGVYGTKGIAAEKVSV